MWQNGLNGVVMVIYMRQIAIYWHFFIGGDNWPLWKVKTADASFIDHGTI
jgi:hypothetical protein